MTPYKPPAKRPSARRPAPVPTFPLVLEFTREEFLELQKRARLASLTPEAWAKAILLNGLALAQSIENLTRPA